MARRNTRLNPGNAEGDNNNVDNDMHRAIQDMANMAASIAQQTAAKTQRDLRKQQREEQAVESKGLVDFRRHDPPQFQGDPEPEKADLWLQEIEKIFDVLKRLDGLKVTYATYLLLGDAEYWWKGARQIVEANNQEVTWEIFRTKFLDKYFPRSVRTAKEQEFLNLKQGGMTIREYAAKFESLAKKIKAMKESATNRVNVGGPSRSKYPTQGGNQKGKHQYKKPYSRPSGNNQNQRPYRPITSALGNGANRNPNQEFTRRCFKCGKPYHLTIPEHLRLK
ncbi:uncharacterized protein LOC123886460 [Trifolium pratense]|uniref:uncharacterized protein LOC123886460 n=1 Tax=Trifolium pratense TaxID=57577 RepID=UPI001E696E9C|nr:uncharacterized protein LOC123886460 [Trifolium pratense]